MFYVTFSYSELENRAGVCRGGMKPRADLLSISFHGDQQTHIGPVRVDRWGLESEKNPQKCLLNRYNISS